MIGATRLYLRYHIGYLASDVPPFGRAVVAEITAERTPAARVDNVAVQILPLFKHIVSRRDYLRAAQVVPQYRAGFSSPRTLCRPDAQDIERVLRYERIAVVMCMPPRRLSLPSRGTSAIFPQRGAGYRRSRICRRYQACRRSVCARCSRSRLRPCGLSAQHSRDGQQPERRCHMQLQVGIHRTLYHSRLNELNIHGIPPIIIVCGSVSVLSAARAFRHDVATIISQSADFVNCGSVLRIGRYTLPC